MGILTVNNDPYKLWGDDWVQPYDEQYLTFESIGDWEYFAFTIPETVDDNYVSSVSYSVDNGKNWTTVNNTNSLVKIEIDTDEAPLNKVLFKGIAHSYCVRTDNSNYHAYFDGNTKYKVYGNIMSLLYGDDFKNKTSFDNIGYIFARLFENSNELVDVANLILPAITLAQRCYCYMFKGCNSLTTAPELPATTLAQYCYNSMFEGCTSLKNVPELPATTLKSQCYIQMFKGCTSLTTTPKLPATTLADNCYGGMFVGCTSLTTAPKLPATTLTNSCYSSMFKGCTSLETTPELPATILKVGCYNEMFNGCTSLETTPELPATTLADSCYSSMFNGCTSLKNAPELPATTLKSQCYKNMFKGCTSLNSAPELPATRLATDCYYEMFINCTMLNLVKCHISGNISYEVRNWLKNVATTGTFICDINANWSDGASGIPTGWTKKYFNGPTMCAYVNNFRAYKDENDPDFDDITDFDYVNNAGMTRSEYIAVTVGDPEQYNSDKYYYAGNTIEYDGVTYYVWQWEEYQAYMWTTTVDYSTLNQQSIETSGENTEFTALYAFMVTGTEPNYINADAVVPRQLVKIVQLN